MGLSEGFHKKYIPIYLECLCGVLLQLMLLFAFIKDPLKCFRNSAIYLIANLAIADLCVCVKTLLTIRVDPEIMSMEFLDHSMIMASLLTILSIAIDRYVMVSHPFKHHFLMSKKKMILWLLLIWLLSLAESIKQLIVQDEGPYDDLVRHCFYLLIALATFMLYAATVKSYTKQSRSLSLQSNESVEHRSRETRIQSEKRFLNTIIIIASIAVVTILPSAIFGQVILAGGHAEESESGGTVGLTLFTILIVNFVINPVIYMWRLPQYRKTFRIIYTCCK